MNSEASQILRPKKFQPKCRTNLSLENKNYTAKKKNMQKISYKLKQVMDTQKKKTFQISETYTTYFKGFNNIHLEK